MGKKKVTLSLDSKVYDEFREYCEKEGLVLSKRIEFWIADFLEKKKKEAGR